VVSSRPSTPISLSCVRVAAAGPSCSIALSCLVPHRWRQRVSDERSRTPMAAANSQGWSAGARSAASATAADDAVTQTPPFFSGNCACEPGCTGVGALATIPQPPRPKRLVFVPALVLAGALIGALPTSCRRFRRPGLCEDLLSKLLKAITHRAASTMSRAALRSAVPTVAVLRWRNPLPSCKGSLCWPRITLCRVIARSPHHNERSPSQKVPG
jgi:hypothetical protein